MALNYDKNNNKFTWFDSLRKKVIDVDDVTIKFFENVESGDYKIENASSSVKEFMADTAYPDKSIDSYKQWATNVKGLGKSFNFAAIKAKALNLAMNAGIMFLAVKGVELLVTSIGNYINRVEVAKETMEESVSAYKTTKQELSDSRRIKYYI